MAECVFFKQLSDSVDWGPLGSWLTILIYTVRKISENEHSMRQCFGVWVWGAIYYFRK